jgi:hypothetical protein
LNRPRFFATLAELVDRVIASARGALLGIGLLSTSTVDVVGCGETPVRTHPPAPRPDKAALFGDPGLVPTRAGERARLELSRAGEIERGIALLPDVDAVRVDVRIDDDARTVGLVAVVRGVAGSDADAIEATARNIATGVLGPGLPADARFVVEAAAVDAPPPTPRPAWPLLLALLGLGLSGGVAFERSRRILRRIFRRTARARRRRE